MSRPDGQRMNAAAAEPAKTTVHKRTANKLCHSLYCSPRVPPPLARKPLTDRCCPVGSPQPHPSVNTACAVSAALADRRGPARPRRALPRCQLRRARPIACDATGNAIGTGLTHIVRCCSTSKPAAAIAAGVSRAVWQPPNARGQNTRSTARWLSATAGRSDRSHVLVETQLATGAQHASQLGQRARLVRHRAEDQAGHGRIERAILGRQAIGDTVEHLDRDVRAGRGGASPFA
jgi:hypothetical protein